VEEVCSPLVFLTSRHFPGKTQVPYKAFLNALMGQLNTKIIDKKLHLKCLEALVAHQRKQGNRLFVLPEEFKAATQHPW
jgi:hypothetical protein